jgi:hypothetical protein
MSVLVRVTRRNIPEDGIPPGKPQIFYTEETNSGTGLENTQMDLKQIGFEHVNLTNVVQNKHKWAIL